MVFGVRRQRSKRNATPARGRSPARAEKLVRCPRNSGIPPEFRIPCNHLIDHVHPSIEGHRLIADLLTAELIYQGIVDPVSDWQKGQQEQAKRHLDSLGDHYFQLGMKRLDALRLWTMGHGGKE